MSDIFDLKSVGLKVYSILTDFPDARDDDRLLLIHIWSRETNASDMESFFMEMLDGKISHFESVRRMRQKLQEQHPNLRGSKWDARHGMEGSICEQLTFFDLW